MTKPKSGEKRDWLRVGFGLGCFGISFYSHNWAVVGSLCIMGGIIFGDGLMRRPR